MLMLKSCPRCKTGDMFLDQDEARHCMQCGYVQYSPDIVFGGSEMARLFGIDRGEGQAPASVAVQRMPAVVGQAAEVRSYR